MMKSTLMLIFFTLSIITTYAAPIDNDGVILTPNINEYRLPNTVLPSHYIIKITPCILEEETGPLNLERFKFFGDTSIILKAATKNVKEITLHAKSLKIDQSKTTLHELNTTKMIGISKTATDPTTDKYVLHLESALDENKIYNLTFNYVGEMKDDMHGFYRSSYKNAKGEQKWLASTQFEPVYARRVFPCFDEPKFKATFNVTISRHKSFKAISNTHIYSYTNVGDRVVDKFEETPVMSTYLLAFLVSDFKERPETGTGDFLVIARPDAFKQTQYSYDIGKVLLKKLDEFTDLPYHKLGNSKMHLAAIPDFSAGAMENWGLLTFRERALLYDESDTTDVARQSIASIIAHEQAHMWFGDYVTCDWWSYTWLNEGFATYFQYAMTHEANPDWEFDKQFVVDQIHSVFSTDAVATTHPMTDKSVKSPTDISKMFDTISYNKGATIIRMIKHIVGEAKFQEALRAYLKKMEFQNSQPQKLFDEFINVWPDKQKVDVQEFLNDWTTQVGYPVITIKMNADKKSIEVSQKRFLLKNDDSDDSLTYTVPLTFTTSKAKDFTTTSNTEYLKKSDKTKTIKLDHEADWVIANIQQVGYYRVNYDEKTWHQIHHALLSPKWSGIHEINRAQIVDDLMSLARSGKEQYSFILGILEYLETETNYLPWTAAFNGFSSLAVRVGSENQKVFQDYILRLLAKVHKQLGFMEKDKESQLDKYNRPKVLSWACKYGSEDCIKQAKKLFSDMKNDDQTTVPVNIRSAVYCSAIREGNADDYNYLVRKYEKSTVATEEVLILGALGCVKSKVLIRQQYEYILSDKVRLQDKLSSLSALISQNPGNPQVVFELATDDFEKLDSGLGGASADPAGANFLSSVSHYFTESKQIDQLEKFCKKELASISKAGQLTLESAIKSSKQNLEWSEKYLGTFFEYLKAKQDKGAVARKSISLILLAIPLILTYVLF